MHATAWILPAGDPARPGPATLHKGRVTIGPAGPEDALVEPVLVGWEGNCFHAVQRQPIDIARRRGETQVVLGNSGVVRVLRPPQRHTHEILREGDMCLVQANCKPDRFGYALNGAAFGYDATGTVGLFARRTVIPGRCLVPLPEESSYTIEQWAAFSIRYVTAWANWRVAYGTWRLQVTEEDQAAPYVWGWGGGTSFAELTLAALHGAEATIITSHERRITTAKNRGLSAVDRRAFPNIAFDERRHEDSTYVARYRASEQVFLAAVRDATRGLGVSIFVDHLGGSLLRATLKALARQGVVTTAGWREGLRTTFVRAAACIERHQHIHTHYARRSEVLDAMAFGERCGWMPPPEAISPPWNYDDMPDLVDAYAANHVETYFPLVRVNH
ncbi:zinc-binding dehydrogenase [Phytohabitans flavus]|uniref:Zinc-binding dehydrogenase n=1 Tax=Phytohabitans flavus TaxID=1076124 RepID=A0A6F8XLA7_9ACTN|nr:zinc-binding dehydrogenase [Phytohabitans flavus]BCB74595.1 zinc-binding dehydrogenase [Phytohabitans flavus]